MYRCIIRYEEGRKKQARSNKAKQHSTPKAVTFPKKNKLPQVGLEPTTLYTLDRVLYQLSYRAMYIHVWGMQMNYTVPSMTSMLVL